MKVTCISHKQSDHLRETPDAVQRMNRVVDDNAPFRQAVSYVRATNAAKLQKMHAKPFISARSEHLEAVYRLSAHPRRPGVLLSGSYDGVVKLWELSQPDSVASLAAHSGWVSGLEWSPRERGRFVTAGTDGTVKLWDAPSLGDEYTGGPDASLRPTPELVREWRADGGIRDVSVCWGGRERYLTAGDSVHIFDAERSEPVVSFTLPSGVPALCCAWNPSEPDLYLVGGGDSTLTLYDARLATSGRAAGGKVASVRLDCRVNRVAFNPREPHLFLAACDDGCVREFDVRSLGRAVCVYKGHVNAAMDVSWCPTGRKFASAGYDETLRTWTRGKGRSNECYHTKRMERVFSVAYTCDSHYVCSGSRDTAVRVWKADPNFHTAPVSVRQRRSENARRELIERHAHLPAVARVLQKKHAPKHVHSRTKRYAEVEQARKRRTANAVSATRGKVRFVSERQRGVRAETAE